MLPFTKIQDWSDRSKIFSIKPKEQTPKSLNGIPMISKNFSSWNSLTSTIEEPSESVFGSGKKAAGCIVLEKDGRVWVVHPTNQFGGYSATFPKGTLESGMSLQATAVKETFEESGLLVKITGFAIDVRRTTSVARYYFAQRIGGDPADMGWESEMVSLVPVSKLHAIVNHPADKPIVDLIKSL